MKKACSVLNFGFYWFSLFFKKNLLINKLPRLYKNEALVKKAVNLFKIFFYNPSFFV